MKKILLLGLSASLLAAGGAAMFAMSPQDRTLTPGQPTQARVWIQNQGEREAVPVNIGEGQLRAGMGIFAAGDHPHPVGPAGEIDEVGDLRDLCVFAYLRAVRGDRRCPAMRR